MNRKSYSPNGTNVPNSHPRHGPLRTGKMRLIGKEVESSAATPRTERCNGSEEELLRKGRFGSSLIRWVAATYTYSDNTPCNNGERDGLPYALLISSVGSFVKSDSLSTIRP